MSADREPTALHTETCPGELGCAMVGPGHDMHPLQRAVASATPSSWVDGFVGEVTADGWVTLWSLDDERVFRLWHHEPLAGVAEGEPVALHPTYHVLALGGRWVNVLVGGGR
jgi:hypothetical protein